MAMKPKLSPLALVSALAVLQVACSDGDQHDATSSASSSDMIETAAAVGVSVGGATSGVGGASVSGASSSAQAAGGQSSATTGSSTGTSAGGGSVGVQFAMDFSEGAFPDCGWNAYHNIVDDPSFTVTHVVGAGPSARNIVRIELNPTESPESCSPNLGWWGPTGITQTGFAESKYYRYYIRHIGNYPQKVFSCEGGGGWGAKTLIATADPDTQRVFEVTDATPDGFTTRVWQNTLENAQVPGFRSSGAWYAIQIQVTRSSGPGMSDGSAYVWQNNDDGSSPSASLTDRVLDSEECCEAAEFLPGGTPIGTGSSLTVEVAAYEIADAFDPGWYARMGN
jgi:hypothetical protein